MNSTCSICEIDLEESYGVLISLALIDRTGQHELLVNEDPSQIICESCWEEREEEMSTLLKLA